MPLKKDSQTLFWRDLASGLKTVSARPNMYGYKPHTKQYEFHTSNAQGRLFLGGNRSGKTVAGGLEACWWLTGRHPYIRTPRPPVYGRCVSVDFPNGIEKIVRPEISRWLPQSELRGGSWDKAYSKELRTLHLANDSTLEFMSYDQDLDKFAGTSRHFVWFDEEPPSDIFTENKMRLLDVGGSYWITMTPVEGMTWTYDDLYIAARTDPSIKVIEVDMGQNPYLNRGEIESFLVGLSTEERQARVQGRFVSIGGFIYKNFTPKNIIEPMVPPKDWLWVAGLDHGYTNPTAWLWAAIDGDGRIIIFDEHYDTKRTVDYHAAAVHTKNAMYDRIPDYYVGDPSIRNSDPITGTSVLITYVDLGIPIVLGNNDVRAGIDKVMQYIGHDDLEPRLFITRNCVNLLWEISRYRWGLWANRKSNHDKNKKEEPQKKDDHAVDCLRYIIASRPELDTGTELPEQSRFPRASTPVNAYYRTDTEITVPDRKGHVDQYLGEEW